MSQNDYNEIIRTKQEIINKIDELYKKDPSPETESEVLQTLESVTNSTDFNTGETMAMVNSVLDDTLDLDDEDKILTPEQTELASNIVDNVFGYLGDECGEDPLLKENFGGKSSEYMDTLTRSSLSSK